MEFTEGFVDTRFGRIHYREQGTGAPLLLLHSNGFSLYEYEHALPELAAHYRCIAWDLPGHGDSESPQGHLTVHDYASATVAVMDALDIEQAHVCGASIGALACAALGVIAPERALSLIMVEGALRTAKEWAQQWPRIEASFALPLQTTEQIAPRFREVTPDLLQRWNIDRSKAGSWRMVDVMWAIRQYDALADLAQIRTPAAVILGDTGPAIASKDRYQNALPGAPVTVLDNAGHFPMVDDPVAFTAAVHAAIQKITTKN